MLTPSPAPITCTVPPLEVSVTLTSSDGTVQVIGAGEGVSIPREWTGVWETEGYTKIWVIYSEDGSGLE